MIQEKLYKVFSKHGYSNDPFAFSLELWGLSKRSTEMSQRMPAFGIEVSIIWLARVASFTSVAHNRTS